MERAEFAASPLQDRVHFSLVAGPRFVASPTMLGGETLRITNCQSCVKFEVEKRWVCFILRSTSGVSGNHLTLTFIKSGRKEAPAVCRLVWSFFGPLV